MFNSPILDFSISIIFIYLLFSLLTSWLLEAYSRWLNWKGKYLQTMIHRLLGGDGKINWAARLYNHPVIESLSVKYSRLTSYIPDDTFADVLTDLIMEEGKEYAIEYDKDKKEYTYSEESGRLNDDLKNGLKKMDESDLKRTFTMFYKQTEGDAGKFKSAIKNWYSQYQVRMNSTYGKKIKVPLIILGFGIAVFFNIDFFHISERLWTDANLREGIVVAAGDFEKQNSSLDSLDLSKAFFEDYKKSLDLPIGWAQELKPDDRLAYYETDFLNRASMVFNQNDSRSPTWWYMIVKFFGFLMSGFVVSFGAPFWFDLLRKAISIKKTVKQVTEAKS